jgi:hypothetical protein
MVSPWSSVRVSASPSMAKPATLGSRARYARSTAICAGGHAICVLWISEPMVSESPSTS